VRRAWKAFEKPFQIRIAQACSVVYIILLNVDALRAVQTSGPNDTNNMLVMLRWPIFFGQIRFARKVHRLNKDRTKHRSTKTKANELRL